MHSTGADPTLSQISRPITSGHFITWSPAYGSNKTLTQTKMRTEGTLAKNCPSGVSPLKATNSKINAEAPVGQYAFFGKSPQWCLNIKNHK